MRTHQLFQNPAFLLVVGVGLSLTAIGVFSPSPKEQEQPLEVTSRAEQTEAGREGRSLFEKEVVPPSRILGDQQLLALSKDASFIELDAFGKVSRVRSGFSDASAINRPTAQIIKKASAGLLTPQQFETAFRAKMGGTLSEADISEIFALFEEKPASLDSSLYHALANDAIRALVQNGGLETDERWRRYRELVLAPGTPVVVANYMVQHLDFRHQNEQYSDEVESVLFAALQTNHGTIDGAALLVFESIYDGNRLLSSPPAFKQQILQVLSGKGRAPVSRIAALGLSKKFKLSDSIEPTLTLLRESSLSYPGHLLAASLVREIGSEEDLEQLSLIENQSLNPLLVRAIRESATL